MKKFFLVSIVSILFGCKEPNHPEVVECDAAFEFDAGKGSRDCLDAADRLAKLGCPEANDKFMEVCERARKTKAIKVDTDCISHSVTVAEVRTCNVRCLGR